MLSAVGKTNTEKSQSLCNLVTGTRHIDINREQKGRAAGQIVSLVPLCFFTTKLGRFSERVLFGLALERKEEVYWQRGGLPGREGSEVSGKGNQLRVRRTWDASRLS